MNKPIPTQTSSIRLLPETWLKFRVLWAHLGRRWLEAFINREYKKYFGESTPGETK